MQVLKTRESMLKALYRFAATGGKFLRCVAFFKTDLISGILSLWTGLSASILRQSTYSTARFGIHGYLSDLALKRSGQDKKLPTSLNVACAGLSGGIAGLIGNPTEVVLVRMCADGVKPASRRFGYSNPFEALVRIWREEGVTAFRKGISANIARSILMSTLALNAW